MKINDIIAVADCDSFFVSCEQTQNPILWGKPVCVMGNNGRCVVARSKEAKKLGVKMGMPHFLAVKEFPNVFYLLGNMSLYVKKSKEVMNILHSYIPEMEQYSIDEAFLNFKGLEKLYKKDKYELAQFLKNEIKRKTGLPVSFGISTNKTLAKLASHKAKKDGSGICIIENLPPQELSKIKLEDVWGMGRRIVPMLNKYGITNAFEYINFNESLLHKKLGKRGLEMRDELLGKYIYKIDTEISIPKSIQKTSTFPEFTSDTAYIKNAIHYHVHSACKKLRSYSNLKCLCVGLMLKTKDFQTLSVKKDLKIPTDWELDIIKTADELFEELYNSDVIYRSSGIILLNLISDYKNQLSLFTVNDNNSSQKQKIGKCIDKLEEKFGQNIIKTGFYKNIKEI